MTQDLRCILALTMSAKKEDDEADAHCVPADEFEVCKFGCYCTGGLSAVPGGFFRAEAVQHKILPLLFKR